LRISEIGCLKRTKSWKLFSCIFLAIKKKVTESLPFLRVLRDVLGLWILFSGLEGPTLCISAEKKTWRESTCAIAINTWEWDFLFAKISRRKFFLDSGKPNDRSSNWQRVGFEINDSRHFGFDFGLWDSSWHKQQKLLGEGTKIQSS